MAIAESVELVMKLKLKTNQLGTNNSGLWRNRFNNFIEYYRALESIRDVVAYRRLRRSWKKEKEGKPVQLGLKALKGRKVFVRPGTSDAEVLWDVFIAHYHLPPVPLPDDCVILDLGANVGYTTAHFATLYPHATIGVVEMDPDNMALAKMNTEFAKDRCRYLEAAVWSQSGTILYEGLDKWGYHVINNSKPKGQSVKSAQSLSMEEVMEQCQLKQVDYLKMDIEGAEAVVLNSDLSWLDKVRSLKVEYHPQHDEQISYEFLSKIFDSTGFVCTRDTLHETCLVARRDMP